MPLVCQFRSFGGAVWAVCGGLLLAAAVPLAAQEPLDGGAAGAPVELSAEDQAVLESPEARKTLLCSVTPTKPELGFDLKLHAGYEVGVPLKQLAGDGNELTTIFRVIPAGDAARAAYFAQRTPVPLLEAPGHGSASLSGAFDLGEGKYHIDWLMRDRDDRVCSFHWDAEAALGPRDGQVALDIAAGAVRQFESETFQPAPPMARDPGQPPLHLKVIVNFAAPGAAAPTLRPAEIGALVSILRAIARDPRVARISLIAFNLHEQRVLYRQREAPEIDFPALGRAVRSLNPGTVGLQHLAQKHEGIQFLAELMAAEVGSRDDAPDAVVFASPKLALEDAIPADALKQLHGVKIPVFYMSYNSGPALNLSRDTIGSVVKYLKGMEFPIGHPRDLCLAWSEIMGRIGKAGTGAMVAGNAPSR
jgi:hypothetical protein